MMDLRLETPNNTAHVPKTSLPENAKQPGQGVPSRIAANKNSSTVSAPLTEPGDFTIRPETEIPQDLINLRDAPQDGLMDMISTKRALNTVPLSALARDNDISRSSDDNYAPPRDFDRLHMPSKRPRMDLHYVPEYPSSPHENQYLSFNFTRRHIIDKLPEPFKTGIQNSRQWKGEQEIGGLSVTNCLSLYIILFDVREEVGDVGRFADA